MNYAFIDGQNLYRGVKNDIVDKKTKKIIYSGWKLDYRKLRIYLRTKYGIDKAFLFIGKVDGMEWLYKSFEGCGYTLIFKPTTEYINEKGDLDRKGNVDAELVLHTMLEFPNYDKALIVAGDGDYYCLIKHLKKNNKLLRVLVPNKLSFSSLLGEFSTDLVFINDLVGSLK